MADQNTDECTELVLFNPDPFPSSMVQNTIHTLLSESNAFFKEEVPYVGLSNQGATCYMNSLLQTLFMTPEFRKGIYDWQFDRNKHINEADCIPFQLQKLFSKLQTKFNSYIETKELTKSFQWNAGESFEQQDIQEFCRVLFDAVEQTCKNSKAENLISDLYEGSSINYVKCMECLHESQRQESFLDVCLTVKNKIDKIYNDSLEKALQTYLKPEILQGANQYFCDKCNKKVDAHRGTRFFKLPKCLCLILNRFSFDYFTFKRVKLEDFVSFPFILNFNNYINGYDSIKDKCSEDLDLAYFENEQPIPKNAANSLKKPLPFKQPQPKVTVPVKRASKTSKPSSQTTSFLKELKAKNKSSKSNNSNSKDIEISVNSNDKSHESNSNQESSNISDLNSGMVIEGNVKKTVNTKKRAVNFDLEEECIVNDNEIIPLGNEPNVIIEVEDPHEKLETKPKTEIDPQTQADINMRSEKEAFEAMKATRAEHLARYAKEREELIDKYLKEGPLVYELYSILNHTGGAYGGHYYNYTKSFEDGKWYHFDDTSVREIDIEDIGLKVFGGHNKSATAYMLMYRQIDKKTDGTIKLEIPGYIDELLKVEKIEIQKKYEEKCELLKQLTVKVYYKLEVKLIPIKTTNTYNDLLKETIKSYNLLDDIKNCRLRTYSTHTDTMLESYHGRENETLETLKIGSYKTLALEIKKDDEIFEEYDESKTSLRVVLWTPAIPKLESISTLQSEIKKINCFKFSTLKNIHEEISKLYSIPLEKLMVYKKSDASGISIAHLLTNPDKMDWNLVEMVLMENTLLYIEIKPEEGENQYSKWQDAFDKEANRFIIKHNNPTGEILIKDLKQDNDEYQYSIVIDARQTVGDMKNKICDNLNLDPNEIIMKRGGKLGIELKDLNSIISTQHFMSGTSLHLEFGKPSIPGQFRVLFSLARPTDLMNDNFFYVFEDIAEMPIPGEYIASKVKALALQKLKEKKDIDLIPELVRIRERNSERLTRIYKDMPMITQQIFERRMMALEEIKEPEVLGLKEIVIFVRIWNSQTLELSERFEIRIHKEKSLLHVAEEIYKKNPIIQVNNMLGCRILSVVRFTPCSLLSEEWFLMNGEELTCSAHPFYLNNDGYLLVVKDLTIPFRVLTEEEMKKMGVASNNRGKFRVDYSILNKKPMEKALKIHIKSKEDEDINLEIKESNTENKDNNEGGQ